MVIDLRKFYQVTDLGKTIVIANPEDKKYYIDFSSVRGGEIIGKLKQKITFFSPDEPTCVLFTGHIGCGKSTELLRLKTELEDEPRVLPMVPVRTRDGNQHEQGMALLRQMVLARAFPDLGESERLSKITDIFDIDGSLNRLCYASGGHVRDLLRLLNTWIMEEMQLPLGGATLENVIRSRRNEMAIPISDEEWELLRQVKQRKKVSDDQGYQKLIRSRFVFEYRDRGDFWFDINPILAESEELQ